MKYILLSLAMIFSVALSAQENKPTFEKAGDMVKATYYHDNGMVSQVGYYLNDQLHDKWEMFDDEGNKIAMGQYHMGKRTGKWFFWNKNELKEVDFADNRVVNVVRHDNAKAIVVN